MKKSELLYGQLRYLFGSWLFLYLVFSFPCFRNVLYIPLICLVNIFLETRTDKVFFLITSALIILSKTFSHVCDLCSYYTHALYLISNTLVYISHFTNNLVILVCSDGFLVVIRINACNYNSSLLTLW